MRIAELHELSDHIHDLGVEDESLVPSVGFDYQAVGDALGNTEPAESIDFADAASAIKSILLWICSPPDLKRVGARAAALLAWLDPTETATHDRESLTKIARQAGVTKQAISKYLIELRDSLGITVGIGKRHTARQAYRNAQYRALGKGRHASQVIERRGDTESH